MPVVVCVLCQRLPFQHQMLSCRWWEGRTCTLLYILCRQKQNISFHMHECFLMTTFLSPVDTQQGGTRLCSTTHLQGEKNHILDTNGWKIQVKSSAEVHLYAHNFAKPFVFSLFYKSGRQSTHTVQRHGAEKERDTVVWPAELALFSMPCLCCSCSCFHNNLRCRPLTKKPRETHGN